MDMERARAYGEHVMKLDMWALLSGDVARLRFTDRFSGTVVCHRESVAEHSYYTTLYALLIGRYCTDSGTSVDMDMLLSSAVVHDLEESRTGDFNRTFKYSSPDIINALSRGARREMRAIAEELCPDVLSDMQYALVDMWNISKDDSVEGRILSFADFLSVLSYFTLEVQFANHTMRRHYESMDEYMRTFDNPMYDFIRPLVEAAKEILYGIVKPAITDTQLDCNIRLVRHTLRNMDNE